MSVQDRYTYQISIPPEAIKVPTKHQDELKVFLTPTVIASEAKKVKKFAKQYKS